MPLSCEGSVGGLSSGVLEEETLLGKIALKRGVLTRDELKACLRARRRGKKVVPLVAVLIEKGYVDDEQLESILADQRRLLEKRARRKKVKKKLRESQVSSVAPSRRVKAQVAEEGDAIVACPRCGKSVQGSARSCMHCGKGLLSDQEEQKIDRRRARSEFLCNRCLYPVFEEETACPSCHASFLKPGEGGEFKCLECGHFVSDKDRVCPWCEAFFAEE